MKKQTYLKHLDRGFTEAPSELNASVEEAFRRGEKAMKQRHKIVTALSVAAAIAALCAAIALAAGRMITPRPDTVAARGNAASKPGRARLSDTQAPTPELTPQPTPRPVPSDVLELVYTQPNSSYYHSAPDCSGMVDAVAWTLESAVSVGKQPCPICMTGSVETEEAAPTDESRVLDAGIAVDWVKKLDWPAHTPTPVPQNEERTAATGRVTPVAEEYGVDGEEVYNDDRGAVYYATMMGKYYHKDPHCSGMKDALPWTFEALWRENGQALRNGGEGYRAKQPCPMCVDWESPVVNVYATPKGRYYHIIRDCSGMKNATRYDTDEAAEEQGKTPCPVCLPDGDNLCWATPGGRHYHIERECMGMKGARICMETSAQRQGKTPCPVCWKRGTR